MRNRLFINTIIVLWAIAAGVFASIKPWQMYQLQNKEAQKHTAEMRKAEDHRDDLIRQAARAHSDIGKEELARQKGYVGPGEVPVDPDKK